MRDLLSTFSAAAWLLPAVVLVVGVRPAAAAERWYTEEQVNAGALIYAEHCAWCHGDRAEGEPGWEQRDSLGFYPPPPLDESGHADEHPLAEKLLTLRTGGGPFGGTMPSFADILSDDDMLAVLAWVQSLWSDEVYAAWAEIDAGRIQPASDHSRHH